MVCPRCIAAVEHTLSAMGYTPMAVELGKATVEENISYAHRHDIAIALEALGFELLDDASAIIINEIKREVLAWVRVEGNRMVLSDFLQSHIHKEYSVLSKLFSDTQGVTIERYAITARIEYAKELLSYGQMTVSEIAYKLGYSSAAHLSMQFKKETGLSPTQFRVHDYGVKRKSLDSL